MKRISLLLISLVLIMGYGCKKDKATKTKQTGPQEYVYKDYGFAIKFDNPPKKQESVVPTNIGDVTAVAIGDDQGTEAYLVYVNIYPDKYKDQVNASEAIKKQVMQTAQNLKLTIVEEKENNFDNKPSYYVVGQDLSSNLHAVIQGVASGTHVYVIAAMAQGENGDQIIDTKGQDFIKSFRLLEQQNQ